MGGLQWSPYLLKGSLVHSACYEFQSVAKKLMMFYAKFLCGKDDTSFSKMSMSPQKDKNHCCGVYTHGQVALEGR